MTPIKKSLILLAAATAFSCSDKQAQQQQNSVDDMQAIEQQEPSISNTLDSKAIEKIQTFYSRHIFGDEFANDSVIATYCTKNLAQELSKAYDNEFSDGGGYAVWKFRSDAQDGEDIHEVEKSSLSVTANTSSITTTWATKAHTPSLSPSKTARFSLTNLINRP